MQIVSCSRQKHFTLEIYRHNGVKNTPLIELDLDESKLVTTGKKQLRDRVLHKSEKLFR